MPHWTEWRQQEEAERRTDQERREGGREGAGREQGGCREGGGREGGCEGAGGRTVREGEPGPQNWGKSCRGWKGL